MPSARSISRCGTSKAKSQGLPVHAVARRHGPQLLRVLQHRRQHPGHPPGHERQGTRRMPPSRPAIAPSAWAPADTPANSHLQHPRARQPIFATSARRRAKASAKTAIGASTSTSASTSPTPSAAATMIEDLAPFFVEDPVRTEAFLRRPPDPAPEGQRPLRGRRGVGQSLGLQQTRGRSRHRFYPRHAAQRRRHHRDDEDCRHLRNPFRRHRPALHRTHRDRRPGQLPRHFLRPGADGVQLPGPHHTAHARRASTSRTESYIPTTGRAWALSSTMKQLKQIAEITQPVTARAQTYFRPDGSITNW